eukprot:11410249-Alexandrium_andersonii.AAC.1
MCWREPRKGVRASSKPRHPQSLLAVLTLGLRLHRCFSTSGIARPRQREGRTTPARGALLAGLALCLLRCRRRALP